MVPDTVLGNEMTKQNKFLSLWSLHSGGRKDNKQVNLWLQVVMGADEQGRKEGLRERVFGEKLCKFRLGDQRH